MKQNIISPDPNVLIKDMNQVEFVSFMVNTVSPTMVQHQLDNLDQVMDQTTEVIEKVMPRAIKLAEKAIDQAEKEEPHLTFDERQQHLHDEDDYPF